MEEMKIEVYEKIAEAMVSLKRVYTAEESRAVTKQANELAKEQARLEKEKKIEEQIGGIDKILSSILSDIKASAEKGWSSVTYMWSSWGAEERL